MNQEQFNQLYDRLSRYAYYRAGRYFHDQTLRQDAADEAMNRAVDTWMEADCYDEQMAKRAIQSSLRQSSRKRQVEPITVHDYENMHGYEIR